MQAQRRCGRRRDDEAALRRQPSAPDVCRRERVAAYGKRHGPIPIQLLAQRAALRQRVCAGPAQAAVDRVHGAG
eukprot:6498052-Prymnesium_polylepis.1